MSLSKKHKLMAFTLCMIVVGALLGREYPRAEVIVVVVALGIYALAGARGTWRRLRNFKHETRNDRLRAAIKVCFAAVAVSIVWRGEVGYFYILSLFFVDIILDNK